MKKILIVEDDKKSLYLARFILQKEGYEVVEAGDGLEALDKISSETPDLILMDMQLPKLDGYEATRRIKANEKSIKIPVIALTAYAMKGDREKIIEAGCSGYIEKPIDPATFAEEVKKFIRGTGIMKILIVDDNEQNLYMLQVLLKARGYEVVSAANGAEALEKARRDPPDMIISDILMPVMDGFTLCREWKGDERLNEIPFIFYTATYSDPKDEELALSLGAERLIVKPVEPDEFIRILQNIIIDVEKGQVKPLKPVLEEDKKGFKLYSERLVKKLEKKMVDLEKEITKRKQVEEEIKSNEVRFRELFKNMNSGVAIYEAKDNGNDFIFKDFNPAAERIEKIKKEDLIDKSVLEVFPWVKEFGLFDVFKRVWETGEPEHHPITLYKDKRVVGWRENYAYKLPSGEIVAVYDDVTERKRTVEALRQSQKMEAIGTLAGGIAHDFNNILGSIIGYTEIANLQATEGDTVEESLKEVLKAGLRATDLVKQILAFSRKGEQKRIPVQISNIVKEALKLLRSSLPTTIEIHQTIESDTGIVEADPTQIHQVLMNLCTNAGHAMREEGGVLEVGIRNVGVVSRDSESEYLDMTSGPYLLLTVSDTGKGMTPEVLGRIFEPYFTTKKKGEGTGLGLAVVDGIVKSHGGTIRVYNRPGKGTSFHVYLPRTKEVKEMAEVESRPDVISTGHERILFVDDEPALAKLGKKMLERLGYNVTSKTSSIEALELFRAKPDQFDLVITDTTMPNMAGDKLSGELMQIRPDIPIILCTGFSGRISEAQAKGMGIKAFVMKPLVIRDLASMLRKVLGD